MKKYVFKSDKKVMKQGYSLSEVGGQVVYEARCLKQPLIGAASYEFVNQLTKKSEEHKVGAASQVGRGTGVLDLVRGNVLDFTTSRPDFKFDGKYIWDLLRQQGISGTVSVGRGGGTYKVLQNGQEIASISESGGVKVFSMGKSYDVETSEEYLDVVFLVLFAIARTENANNGE